MSFGGSAPAGNSTTTVQQSPGQIALQGAAMPLVSQFTQAYNGGNGGILPPSQQPFTPEQTQAQGMLTQAAGAGGALQKTADDAGNASHFMTTQARDVNNNPALTGAISAATQPITQNFQQSVIPSLRTDAVNAGGLGGSRDQNSENQATNSYLREIGNTTSGIVNNAYNKGLDATGVGLTQAPNTIRAQTFPGQTMDAVGAAKQDQLTAQNQSQFTQQMFPLDLATQMFQAANGIQNAGTSTTTTPAAPTSALGKAFKSIFG